MLSNIQDRQTLTAAQVAAGDLWWNWHPWSQIPEILSGINGTGDKRTPQERWKIYHVSALLCAASAGTPIRWGSAITLGLISPRPTGMIELATICQGVMKATVNFPQGLDCFDGVSIVLSQSAFADTDYLYVTVVYERFKGDHHV
jgi:hypothetical protein